MVANEPVSAGQDAVGEEEAQRAELYALLGRLLLAPPKADLLAAVGRLKGDESELGAAVGALAAAARASSVTAASEEFHELFLGPPQGELMPYGSYYRAGALYKQPLADLRRDMKRIGIARDPATKEPEDHIAMLCEMMAGLILGAFGDRPAPLDEQRRFFETHIQSWAPRFFADLEGAKAALLYMPLGRIGSLFMAIERTAFEIAE